MKNAPMLENMNEDIEEALSDLGLDDKERTVYLACLAEGGVYVHEIVSTTKLKRSTINLVIERLLAKGFVAYRFVGRRRIYTAEPPEKLAFQLEDALTNFRSIIPLLRVSADGKKSSRVRFFEGPEGLRSIFADILLTAKLAPKKQREILVMSSGEDLFRVLPNHQREFINKRVREQIPARLIVPGEKHATLFSDDEGTQYRDIRVFNGKKYPFDIEMDLYGNRIALMKLDAKKPTGVIIEDATLSGSLKSMFSLLWDSLKEPTT